MCPRVSGLSCMQDTSHTPNTIPLPLRSPLWMQSKVWYLPATLAWQWPLLSSKVGFPDDTSDKEPACQCRWHKRHVFSPWVGKISWRRAWQLTQYSFPENPMDRGAWWATVHSFTKRRDWSNLARMHASPRHRSRPCDQEEGPLLGPLVASAH